MNKAFFQRFAGARIRGGFEIVRLDVAENPLVDPLGREAIARTYIIANQFFITISAGLSEDEISVTIYHEILEAATVGSIDPPKAVRDFSEGDFESAGYRAHKQFGQASPENLDRMLQFYGF